MLAEIARLQLHTVPRMPFVLMPEFVNARLDFLTLITMASATSIQPREDACEPIMKPVAKLTLVTQVIS
jgi:hypothetical protein